MADLIGGAATRRLPRAANTLAPPLMVATDNPHRHRLHMTTFVLMHH